jgi:four helix bundle protein
VKLGHAASFKDLVVYQRARQIARRFFAVSKGFPKEEMFALTDQGRRSSRAVGAEIAEAWAKRRYEKHFISKLTDADAEQLETQHWVETAGDCGYVSKTVQSELVGELEQIGRMLSTMMSKASLFCGPSLPQIRETAAPYFVSAPTDDVTDHRSLMTDH